MSLNPEIHFILESFEKNQSLKKKKCKRAHIDILHSECLLDNLFPFKSETDFLQNNFKLNPVVSRGDNDCGNILKELLFDLDISELIKNSASERIHVWLKGTQGTLDSISVDDHSQAIKLYHAGHSIYCRAPAELEHAVVPRLLDELGIGIIGSGTDKYRRGEIELFLSRKGHATDFHTDFQENFTIQISGTKKWIFRKSSAVAPLRGCTPHFQTLEKEGDSSSIGLKRMESDLSEQQLKVLRLGDPSFSADQYMHTGSSSGSNSNDTSVVLNAGDCLYHPAGIWHRVECEEDSISINISLICSSYAEIFCSGLQQLLLENAAFRGPAVSGGHGNAQAALIVMRNIMECVPKLLKSMEPSDFLPVPCLGVKLEGRSSSFAENNSDSSGSSSSSSKGGKRKDEKEENENGSSEEEMEEEEEQEGEEEEEDVDDKEESTNSLPPIFAESMTLPSAVITNISATKIDKPLIDMRFRINPLVQVISSGDLIKFRSSSSKNSKQSKDDSTVHVVHSSFGNESFESVLRQVVVVPLAMSPISTKILAKFVTFQISRQKAMATLSSNNGENKLDSDSQKKSSSSNNKKRKVTDSKQISDEKNEKPSDRNITSDISTVEWDWNETGFITTTEIFNSLSLPKSFNISKIDLYKVFFAFVNAGALILIS